MRENEQNTPPSSISGDEIGNMDEEGVIYMEDMELIELDDEIEDVTDQEESDTEMEPPQDHALLAFSNHIGSVFSCDLHPNGKLAVTGGEDDKAYVWSTENGEIFMECLGHKDSVVFVGFSFDGVYLATVDMGGLIKVWKCNLDSNQVPWTVVFEYEIGDLSWSQWHFGAKVLICGVITGDIYVFKIPSGETKVLQGNNVKVECGKLFQDGVRLAAGYEDGLLKVWDLKTSSALYEVSADTHSNRVLAIDLNPEGNLMASICTDGKVILTKSSNGKVVGQLEAEDDLEAVVFTQDPQMSYFALGSLNGAVSIWDSARQMIRHHCAKSSDEAVAGVTKMIWVKNHLVTGCLDGSVRAYEGRSGERVLMLTGHRSEILDFCYNEKENLILTTSDDGTARIFKYEVNKEKD